MSAPAIIPFDKREGYIWMNGEILPWQDAKVHVLTHGLHYGSSVFEGERAYKGKIFKSREHSERLIASAQIMDMEIPYSIEEIEEAKRKIVELNGGGDQYVRPVAFRGSEMMAVSAQHNRIHVAVATWSWPSMFDPATKMKGIKLDIAEYRRPDPACAPVHAKAAGLYMICTLQASRREAWLCRCHDARLAGPRRGMHRCQTSSSRKMARSTPRWPIASSMASPAAP